MSNTELARYKTFLQQHVFAGWGPPDDLKEWVRLFERMTRKADLGQQDDAAGSAPANAQAQPGQPCWLV